MSKNTWDPTKLDDVDGASDLMISQFPPIPLDAIDSFYNDQGDICATKSDSEVDFEVDPAVVDSEVGPAVVEFNEQYHPKPNGEEYRSKPKTKNKRNTKNGSTTRRFDGRTNHKYPVFQHTYYKRMIHQS